MALDYILELTEATDAAAVKARLCGLAGFTATDEAIGAEGVSIFARDADFDDRREAAAERRIAPTVILLLRALKSVDEQLANRSVVRAVVELLGAFGGDLSLQFEGTDLLRRQDGRLEVAQDDDFWSPDLQAMLPAPLSPLLAVAMD